MKVLRLLAAQAPGTCHHLPATPVCMSTLLKAALMELSFSFSRKFQEGQEESDPLGEGEGFDFLPSLTHIVLIRHCAFQICIKVNIDKSKIQMIDARLRRAQSTVLMRFITNVMREVSKAIHLFVIFDGQTKVPNLAAPIPVQEDVVWLDVQMQNVMAVQKFQALHHRVHLQIS